jgi:hypothetical protein
MPQCGRRKHRAQTLRRARASAGLTAIGTVGAVITVFLIVVGSVLTPSGAATHKPHHHRTRIFRPTRTVTATATSTITARPTWPYPTRWLPTPTATVTVTPGPSWSPSTAPTGTPTGTPTTATNSPSTPSTWTSDIGVYMSGNNSGLNSYTSGWSVQPNLASFYLNWNSTVPALMKTYASQGREIQVELSTKIVAGSWVTWNDVAKGTYDAHIVSLIKSLDALGTPVMLALDVEPDGQYQGGTGVAPNQTPAQYVAAADHFADLIHANSTHVQSLVWLAGFKDAATSASFLPAHSKIDNIGWDPYMTGSYSASETPAQLFSRFITTVLVPYGYGDIPRHICETGIKTDSFSSGNAFSTQTQIAFMEGIPAAMSADDIDSVMWFRDNAGAHDYIPTSSSVDQTFAKMVDNLLD